MNIDQLFEELETQFDAALDGERSKPQAGIARLTATQSGNRISFEKPTFGDTYICGLVTGRAIWRFQPHRTLGVARITFHEEALPPAEEIAATDLLGESLVGRFVRYSLSGDGQQVRKGRVLSVLRGLLLFESNTEVVAVALERLGWLEVHAADN